MKTFNEYMKDWWDEFLGNISPEDAKRVMEDWIGEEETIEDYIPEDAKSPEEWLSQQTDYEQIYEYFFGFDSECVIDNLPDAETFLTDMFNQAVAWSGYFEYSAPDFADDFISDMAHHACGYSTPDGFFKDLQYGCASGMIEKLIYNSECKEIYINHIDDLEEYKMQLEDEIGEAITNRKKLPHYVFMCWLCYEELGYMIGRTLFPEKF